jgi:hypothetical protein
MAILPYNRDFFEAQAADSLASAKEIIPALVNVLTPRSIVDVGCGLGTWLSVFPSLGVTDILGIDGDYVDRDMLLIPKDAFVPHDLATPLELPRRFDLVISLETAEHLPPISAETFVRTLTKLGDVVLFSAAVPGQAWTKNIHLNEQWPDYWRKLFDRFGFCALDCIRGMIWNNPRVCWWYAQNMILFARREHEQDLRDLWRASSGADLPLSIVHPRMLRQYADFDAMTLRRQWWLIRRIVSSFTKKLTHKVLNTVK